MLKVASYLFFNEQDPKYMDYYERTVLNHILGGRRNQESTDGPREPVHVPGAARRAQGVRQRQHRHVLRRHRAREPREVPGGHLLPLGRSDASCTSTSTSRRRSRGRRTASSSSRCRPTPRARRRPSRSRRHRPGRSPCTCASPAWSSGVEIKVNGVAVDVDDRARHLRDRSRARGRRATRSRCASRSRCE